MDRVKLPLDIGRPSLTENYHAQAVTGSTQVNAYLPVIWFIEPAIGAVSSAPYPRRGVRRAYVALIAPTGKVGLAVAATERLLLHGKTARRVAGAAAKALFNGDASRSMSIVAPAAIAPTAGAMGGCSRRSPAIPCCRRQIRHPPSTSSCPGVRCRQQRLRLPPSPWRPMTGSSAIRTSPMS